MTDSIRPSIYALLDKGGRIKYIGKANDPDKRLKSHMRDSAFRDTPVYRWIRENGQPKMVVLKSDCEDWRSDERALIAEARERGCDLLNVANGGAEPFCPADVRAKNGAKVAKLRVSTPQKKRLYELRSELGRLLKRGFVSEATKAKMRGLAAKYPSEFSAWAKA